jgi:hypothetical protein
MATRSPLTAQQLHRLIELDMDTGELTWRPIGSHVGGTPACIVSADERLCVNIAGRLLDAAQVVWALMHGTIPDAVEHLNGDMTDYRPCNLRPASRAGAKSPTWRLMAN